MSLPKQQAKPLTFTYALFFAFSLILVIFSPIFAGDSSTTVGDLSARIDDLERQLTEGHKKSDDANPGDQVTGDDLRRLKEEIRALKSDADDRNRLREDLNALRADMRELQEENRSLKSGKSSKKSPSSDAADEKSELKEKEDGHKPKKPALQMTHSSNESSGESIGEDDAEAVLMLLEKSVSDENESSDSIGKKGKKDIDRVREAATKNADDTAPSLTAGNGDDQYNEALALHDKGAYKKAEKVFGEFIKSHPNDPLVSKAMFWKADSCLRQKNYKDAKILLVNAYKKNPKGPKAPDCLLKLGEILAIQGKKEDARTAWKKLKLDFPHMTSELKAELASLQKTYGVDQKSDAPKSASRG
ncbi:MAG: tetratricopeptide repeat protein [Alphaproteobacteria bacterium]|nr:tetratricopeptide repeat protein [Alphaproteobacteria bacterium]